MALAKALRTAAQGFFFFFFTCRLSAAEGGGPRLSRVPMNPAALKAQLCFIGFIGYAAEGTLRNESQMICRVGVKPRKVKLDGTICR